MTLVTFAATALLAALTIPWIWQPGLWNGASWIGIPVPYFISLFVIPALMFLLLLIYANAAEDIDRHTLEFENE